MTKATFIVMPEDGALDCQHAEFASLDKAKQYAIELAEKNARAYAVFEKIGAATPGARPVRWSVEP